MGYIYIKKSDVQRAWPARHMSPLVTSCYNLIENKRCRIGRSAVAYSVRKNENKQTQQKET